MYTLLGWKAYLVLSTLTLATSAALGLYVVYLVIKANYAAVKLSAKMPAWVGAAYLSFAGIVVLLQVVGCIATVATNNGTASNEKICAHNLSSPLPLHKAN